MVTGANLTNLCIYNWIKRTLGEKRLLESNQLWGGNSTVTSLCVGPHHSTIIIYYYHLLFSYNSTSRSDLFLPYLADFSQTNRICMTVRNINLDSAMVPEDLKG